MIAFWADSRCKLILSILVHSDGESSGSPLAARRLVGPFGPVVAARIGTDSHTLPNWRSLANNH